VTDKGRLTETEIVDIRKLRKIGLKMRAIADTYGVSIPTIKYHTMGIEPLDPEEVLACVEMEEVRYAMA